MSFSYLKLLNDLWHVKIRKRDSYSERDIEEVVYEFLKRKGHKVERQYKLPGGLVADLKVGECFIEIKIIGNRRNLHQVLGHILDYKESGVKCLILFGIVYGTWIEKYLNLIRKLGIDWVIKIV